MSASETLPFESWPRALNDQINWRVFVERQIDSTQDVARSMDARIGDAVVAFRQMRGRGRQGRIWLDTGADGVAMTMVMARNSRPERQAIQAAVALCDAVEATARGLRVGIKWPNDLVIDGRKLAGILVEQVDDRAFVGVGVNVAQLTFQDSLEHSAVSLRQLGFGIDRVDLMLSILAHFAPVLKMKMTDDEALSRFAQHDVLAGTHAAFRIGEREIRGKVLRVDPMTGLAVLTENEGEVWLPAATTSVIKE